MAARPFGGQEILLVCRPLHHAPERCRRKRAMQHREIGDLDLHGPTPEQGMEVRRVVIVPVHADAYCADAVDGRHFLSLVHHVHRINSELDSGSNRRLPALRPVGSEQGQGARRCRRTT